MRIVVTNDDGIDSIGLHVLARAMQAVGEVVVVAPDREYSGCGAALWPQSGVQPEIRRAAIAGVDEAWAVTGPPALCVTLGRLGVVGDGFDLLVSGVNPGINVGRAVYHSGTIGACLTARNWGISGVAVSQAVDSSSTDSRTHTEKAVSVESGVDDSVSGELVSGESVSAQNWDSAAEVATVAVSGLAAAPTDRAVVMNINVPNLGVEEIAGWRVADVKPSIPVWEQTAYLELMPGHTDSYHVEIKRGELIEQPADTDAATVMAGWVSVSWLSRLESETWNSSGQAAAESALDRMFS